HGETSPCHRRAGKGGEGANRGCPSGVGGVEARTTGTGEAARGASRRSPSGSRGATPSTAAPGSGGGRTTGGGVAGVAAPPARASTDRHSAPHRREGGERQQPAPGRHGRPVARRCADLGVSRPDRT